MTASSLSLTSIQAAAGTTVATTSVSIFTWGWPFEAVGLPVAVLFMALIGTACGLVFQQPGGSRARLFCLAFAYTMVSASVAIVLGQIPGFTFFNAVSPATALLFAFFAQTLIPVLRDALAERAKRSIGGGN